MVVTDFNYKEEIRNTGRSMANSLGLDKCLYVWRVITNTDNGDTIYSAMKTLLRARVEGLY